MTNKYSKIQFPKSIFYNVQSHAEKISSIKLTPSWLSFAWAAWKNNKWNLLSRELLSFPWVMISQDYSFCKFKVCNTLNEFNILITKITWPTSYTNDSEKKEEAQEHYYQETRHVAWRHDIMLYEIVSWPLLFKVCLSSHSTTIPTFFFFLSFQLLMLTI